MKPVVDSIQTNEHDFIGANTGVNRIIHLRRKTSLGMLLLDRLACSSICPSFTKHINGSINYKIDGCLNYF